MEGREARAWGITEEAGAEIFEMTIRSWRTWDVLLLFCFLLYFIWQVQKKRYDQRKVEALNLEHMEAH